MTIPGTHSATCAKANDHIASCTCDLKVRYAVHAQRLPTVHPDGLPYCSHMVCPKFVTVTRGSREERVDICCELDMKPQAVCLPALRDAVVERAQLEAKLLQLSQADLKVKHAERARDEAREEHQSTRAQRDGWAKECAEAREKLTHAMENIAGIQHANDILHEKLRIAEAVRDDARAASQRYLDEKRAMRERYEAQCEDQRRTVAERDNLQANYDSVSRNLAATIGLDTAKPYHDAISLYFTRLHELSMARFACNADDIDTCGSSRCRERRRVAEDAAEEARLALGTLVTKEDPSCG